MPVTEVRLLRPKVNAMKHTLLLCMNFLLLLIPCSGQDARQQFASLGNFKLESGETILDCQIGYRTFGKLNADRSNIVVMSTWFTGKTGEMAGLFGEGRLI